VTRRPIASVLKLLDQPFRGGDEDHGKRPGRHHGHEPDESTGVGLHFRVPSILGVSEILGGHGLAPSHTRVKATYAHVRATRVPHRCCRTVPPDERLPLTMHVTPKN
jgi:hypothetical protein